MKTFKRFYFLLCRQNFLPTADKPQSPSKIDILLAQSNEAEEEITKQLYQEYKQIRLDLARHFRTTGSADIPNRDAVLIEKAQKTLDRLLFVAFCEDRGLLPKRTISQAHAHKDPYNPRPIWDNYKSVFRWVDQGNDDPPIPGYNGGLFKHDPLLDEQLQAPALLCSHLKQLARFDFDTEVSVDILGRIFEQSVTDLEELRALATGQIYDPKKGKRKTQGVFYTPAFITQYIVAVALGGYLERREQEIRDRFQLDQIPERATKKRREAEIKFWEAYRDEVLLTTRVVDPACGSGAFLIAVKPYLQKHYESYDGVADLYTYFYEKGLKILKPDGVLSYIVTNKWLRAGYGEPLRRFFTQNSFFEQIIDFGHAPIFEDADTFSCIVSVRRNLTPQPPSLRGKGEPESNSPLLAGEGLGERSELKAISPVLVCPVPREKLKDINLPQYIQQEGYEVPWSRLTADAWSLEPPAVDKLMQKIRDVGVPLKDFIGVKPYRGILTGFNEAFLIDDNKKKSLIQADQKSAEIIKPYLRGQDIKRWYPEWVELWMIFAHKDIDIERYPAVKEHLAKYRNQLDARAGKQLWWQLQASPSFYKMFEKPKLVYQEIQFHSAFSYDGNGYFTNNKCFIFPNVDLYVLAVLNSPLLWWHNWRYLPHMKDEALTPVGVLIETLSIAPPTHRIRDEVEPIVSRLIEITKANQEAHRDVLNWLRIEHSIDKSGQKLEDFSRLDADEFVKEVKKRKPKNAGGFSPKAIKEAQEVYNDYSPAIQSRKAEALTLEHRLSDLVNQAYGLTPEEIDLMWKTAPPRMPINPK